MISTVDYDSKMYIHKIRSGKYKQHEKLLLRESFRVGKTVRNRTLANLTYWDESYISALEQALKAKRDLSGTVFESGLTLQIAKLVEEATDDANDYRSDALLDVDEEWRIVGCEEIITRRLNPGRKCHAPYASPSFVVAASLSRPRYSRRFF